MAQYDDAIADSSASLERDPKSADSLYVRGLAKRRTHAQASGDVDIAAAKTIDSKIADTYAKYGVTP
jgi:hypothetical protein